MSGFMLMRQDQISHAAIKIPGTSPWESWYGVGVTSAASLGSAAVMTADKLWLGIEAIAEDVTIDKLAIETTNAVATSVGRIGIWGVKGPRDKYPGTLLADSGSFTCATATTFKQTLGSPVLLPRGLYWFGIIIGVTSTVTVRGAATGNAFSTQLGFPNTLGANAWGGATLTGAAGQAQSSAFSVWANPMPAGVVLVTGGAPVPFYHCSA